VDRKLYTVSIVQAIEMEIYTLHCFLKSLASFAIKYVGSNLLNLLLLSIQFFATVLYKAVSCDALNKANKNRNVPFATYFRACF